MKFSNIAFMKNIAAILSLLVVLYGCSLFNNTMKKERIVLISTSLGDIKVKLYNDTPLHRDNFIKLVEEGFYDSLLFHRVIPKFMIQGGDPTSKNAKKGKSLGEGDVDYKIPAEFIKHRFHKKGALAAAREGDDVNPKKESSGCQFYIVQGTVFEKDELIKTQDKYVKHYKNKFVFSYINQPENKDLKDSINWAQKNGDLDMIYRCTKQAEDAIDPDLDMYRYSDEQIAMYTTIGGSPHLDGSYTVFGEVIEGMNVVDSITQQATDRRNRPLTNIVFSAKVLK